VVSVEETERRAAFSGYYQVAIITLSTGKEYIVEDGAGRAGRLIAEARQQNREGVRANSEGHPHALPPLWRRIAR
jgi:hypothetical protein